MMRGRVRRLGRSGSPASAGHGGVLTADQDHHDAGDKLKDAPEGEHQREAGSAGQGLMDEERNADQTAPLLLSRCVPLQSMGSESLPCHARSRALSLAHPPAGKAVCLLRLC